MVQAICDCGAVQSAVCLSECLAAAPVFLLGATRHFVLFSCKTCAEIVVHRMFAVLYRTCFFSDYLFYSRFQD